MNKYRIKIELLDYHHNVILTEQTELTTDIVRHMKVDALQFSAEQLVRRFQHSEDHYKNNLPKTHGGNK